MNYMRQIIAFDKWEELNPLPDKSYRLWFKLMKINNFCGWTDWFSVPLLKLKSELHTQSDQTVYNARNALVQAGRIEVKKGKNNQAAYYHLIPLNEVTPGATTRGDSGVENGVHSGVGNGEGSGTLYKLNETKRNNSQVKSNNARGRDQRLKQPIPLFKLTPKKQEQRS